MLKEMQCTYFILKASVNGVAKLQECLAISCQHQKVARFVSCDFWKDKHGHGVVAAAITNYLEKAWKVRNMCKHNGVVVGVTVGVETARNGRGADGSTARA